MAVIIDEQKMLTENMFNYEDRVKSSLSRFSDKTFTPVDYYHIDNNGTTMDGGFGDAENILGARSPIKFQEIKNFPLYLNDAINLDISESEVGLDSSYSSEATILPGTIVPLPNDYFILKQLKDSYVFRVTETQSDIIMPDNYYKINFELEFIDSEKQEDLKKQTSDAFTCMIENIGTSEKCIIEDSQYNDFRRVLNMYIEMVDTYTTFFYNERYNCLLGDWENNMRIFDPLQTEFIRTHQLFTVKKQLDNLVLNDQFSDARRKIKYENSIYRFIELRDIKKLSRFPFCVFNGTNNKQTGFSRWQDRNIKILDIQAQMDPNTYTMLSDESEAIIRLNLPTTSKYLSLISQYIRDPDIKMSDIDLTLPDVLLTLNTANLEVFFFTPIILYILKDTMKRYMVINEIHE